VFNPLRRKKLIARAADLLGKGLSRPSPSLSARSSAGRNSAVDRDHRDIAFDGAEAVVGPVIIATMLLPYLVPPLLVRQIRPEGERARGFY
jgi:hypothetical protein